MKYIGVDIGIIHFSMVGAEVNDLERKTVIEYDEIYFCELINITELIDECPVGCKLHHEKTICDYMMHLFQKYRQIFDEADEILIERQPLQGLVSVQDLILREYRDKSKLVSPNSMHKYFGIGDYNYDHRKILVEKRANDYLSGFKQFCFNERKHDMADAFCIMYYYLTVIKEEVQEKAREKRFRETHKVFLKKLEDYRYVNPNKLKNES